MHSSETAPASGPGLLLQLGQLILRARTDPQRPLHKPSTSHQVLIQTQPKVEEDEDRCEDTFRNHINALWTDNVPICVEVILAPSCSECYPLGAEATYRGLLLERWTITTLLDKSESPAAISSPWLLNAVRSQLHFSQLAAWRARAQPPAARAHERRRKLSREINIKKVEANIEERKLNVVYSVKTPAECAAAFAKPPTDHTFPLTDIGSGKYLKVEVASLPRLDAIPAAPCACARAADELAHRLTDLTIGSRKFDGAINSNIGTPSRRLSIISNPGSTEYLFIDKDKLVDDRMHTPCSESGKHKCNCDDESDGKDNIKKLDEKRIKEIAKYKRKVRKEIRKLCDSTSSEGEVKKETTSIPILQAARFDRFRAIGCYRNQTYLTLPASKIETKSPFVDTDYTPPILKTNSVATQTDFLCPCGNPLEVKCDSCVGMVRSEGNYNLSSLQEYGVRRKLDDVVDKSLKKQKCDNNDSVCSDIIKRPKLRGFFLKMDKLDKIVNDRNNERDLQDLHLKTDDTVFSMNTEFKDTDGQLSIDKECFTQKTDNPFSMDKEMDQFSFKTENYQINNQFSVDLPGKPDGRAEKGTENMKRPDGQAEKETESVKRPDGQAERETESVKRPDGQAEKETESVKRPDGQAEKETESVKRPDGQAERETESVKRPDGQAEKERPDGQFLAQSESKRQKTFSTSDDDYVLCDYGTIDRHEIDSPKEEKTDFKFSVPKNESTCQNNLESSKDGFIFPDPKSEVDRFRWGFDSSSMFHAKTGLPLTSSPAPLRRGNSCFDFDDSINDISGIKSALSPPRAQAPPPAAPAPARAPRRRDGKSKFGSGSGLLGSFEESLLQGRLPAVAEVRGFTAELGASGPAFCAPHRRLPAAVRFYGPAAPYTGHINLGPGGYRVARAGTVQVSLFNPHGTLVKMFVVLYDLSRMPPAARTFLRQRTLHQSPQATRLRYLIHLRFMTSKSGKLYLHTDIRLIVSRKADLDTAALPRCDARAPAARSDERAPAGHSDSETHELGFDNASFSYELRSVTYSPDHNMTPDLKYSPR